jgi:pimeloyl-ACP methyl ester carboxylesterase
LYTCQTLYRSLEAWIAGLPVEPPYTLVGHSLGGYLSLRFALQHPAAVRALALVNPLYSRTQLRPLPALGHRRPGLAARALRWVTPQMMQIARWDPLWRLLRLRIAMDYKRAVLHPNSLRAPSWI